MFPTQGDNELGFHLEPIKSLFMVVKSYKIIFFSVARGEDENLISHIHI